MGFGIVSFVFVLAILQRKACDAVPTVTLTGERMFYDGSDLNIVCAVDQDVDLLSVSFFKGVTETIWINNPTTCTFFKLIPEDTSSYNTTCNSNKTSFTLTKYRLNISDDNSVWSCQMKSKPGGSGQCIGVNNPCKSGSITLSFQIATTEQDKNTTKCDLELGLGLGLGLGIPCVITVIVVILIYTAFAYQHYLGLAYGLSIGVTFQVGWIIIVSLISTGNKCKLELGLGLGLGSGIPDGILCFISVIFVFFDISIFKAIPNRVELGKGMLTGFLFAHVITIIVVYFIYDKLKPEETDKKSEVQLEQSDTNGKSKNSGPPAVHIGTQNKVDPNSSSKKTNDRQPPPVPPTNTGFEDTPTIRKLPPPPQNGEIKDRNVRGISATFGDTSDLASETPRPNRLQPLSPKQATVQKEDALEEPKKKRKKKKKKDQINEETPEEENGKTNLSIN